MAYGENAMDTYTLRRCIPREAACGLDTARLIATLRRQGVHLPEVHA